MKELKFKVRIKTKDIFAFLLYHTYSAFSGLFGIFLSLSAFILLITSWGESDDTKKIVLLFISVLFTLVNPGMLYVKAKRQLLLNPIYKEELEYIFNDEGIKVIQNDAEALIQWKDIKRIAETKSVLLVYTSAIHAFIFPKTSIEKERKEINSCFSKNLDKKGVKMPKSIVKN